jgi:transposase
MAVEIEKAVRRKRSHSREFKEGLVRACSEPGVSVAGIALANGVNANLLRKWMVARGVSRPRRRRQEDGEASVVRAPEFVPVAITPAESSPPIRIEARRGEVTVKLEWPVAAAGECARWLRGWLK